MTGEVAPPVPVATTLATLVTELPAVPAWRVVGDPATVVTGMTHDSHRVAPGDLFACVRGAHADGHRFAGAAVAAGASAVLVDHPLDVDVAQIVVGDTRRAMGPLAAAVNGHPSRALTVAGITGTNGKTTTAHLLAAILDAAGRPAEVIGTLSGAHTTPEAPELQRRLADAAASGRRSVVMEVSSHALALHRVDGTRYAVAVFTNLGTDHLDLHGTPEEYFRAKARLFTPELAAVGVTNVDDAHGRLLFDARPIEMVPYSPSSLDGVEVTAGDHRFSWRGRDVRVGLGGPFNVANSLAAATAAEVLGVALDDIVAGLGAAGPVPGRFERITAARSGVTAIVDYAHTPDGLSEVIGAARDVTGGRVVVVFGCGGDRDRAKRPVMGAVAASLADRVVVTSDNPRSEDPAAIIAAVLEGVAPDDRSKVDVEPDREAAIALALAAAGDGDVVVVAGKGHETTQTVGDQARPFDDREVVRRLLEAGRTP